jgi:hypothetical protein
MAKPMPDRRLTPVTTATLPVSGRSMHHIMAPLKPVIDERLLPAHITPYEPSLRHAAGVRHATKMTK